MAEPVRVALLARPGTACEQLQAALVQAGAEVVLVADPLGSDAGSVAAAAPGAVLVALDAAVEDVLDRYDPVLLDPAMTVIYDEAELAAKREGWDAARWTRHLAAKLAGHDDVLPPGAGSDPVSVAPSVPEVAAAAPRFDSTLDFEPAPDFEPTAGFEPATPFEPALAPVAEAQAFGIPADTETASSDGADGGIRFEGIVPDGELSLDALEFDLAPMEAPVAAPAQSKPVSVDADRPNFDFSALSLEDIPGDAIPAAPGSEPVAATESEPAPGFATVPAFAAPATPAEPGAVVVLAGIGGPDAVRQFLSALPEGFPRPVLVRQRLDGGRHDRLVRQMQRATSLPVELAEAGARLAPGHVYILPDGMATDAREDGGRFVAAPDPVPVLAGLPPAGSAILMLSGSDPAMVADVHAAAQGGALVGGQSPEECFDGAAPAALIAGGGEGAAPADLAARLSARWPS